MFIDNEKVDGNGYNPPVASEKVKIIFFYERHQFVITNCNAYDTIPFVGFTITRGNKVYIISRDLLSHL